MSIVMDALNKTERRLLDAYKLEARGKKDGKIRRSLGDLARQIEMPLATAEKVFDRLIEVGAVRREYHPLHGPAISLTGQIRKY